MHEDYEPEIWVPLKLEGFGNRYSVSSYGRVWDNENEQFVSPSIRGVPAYYYVNLRRVDGERRGRRVHNIVLRSFKGEPADSGTTCDHIDRNKNNNCLWNLRWASRETQMNNRDCCVMVVANKRGEIAPLLTTMRLSGLEQYYGRVRILIVDEGMSYEEALLVIKERDKPKQTPLVEVLPENIIQTDLHCFPTMKSFEEYHNISTERRRKQIKEGMSLQEIVDYIYDPSEQHRFYIGEFFMTREEHCVRCGTSIERVRIMTSKHNMTFEEAIKIKPKRIIKHTINGEIKRNHEWFTHFGINPRQGNGKLCGKECNKDMRKVLEFFGVDTSGMEITPYI